MMLVVMKGESIGFSVISSVNSKMLIISYVRFCFCFLDKEKGMDLEFVGGGFVKIMVW